jgi:hypothetical protein
MSWHYFVPVYGPFKEIERVVTSHDEPFAKRVGYAIAAGGTFGAHIIFGGRHLAHIQAMDRASALHLMHAKRHRAMLTRTLPIVTATYAVVTASVGYETAVNEPLRSGHRNIWFGPFSSGLGPVV